MGKILLLTIFTLFTTTTYSDSGADCPAGKVWSASVQACVIYVPADQPQNIQIINKTPPPISGDSDIDHPEHGTSAYYQQQSAAEAGRKHVTTDSDRWEPVVGDPKSNSAEGAGACATAFNEAITACKKMNDVGFSLMLRQMFGKAGAAVGTGRASCAIQGLQGSTSLGSTVIAGKHCWSKASSCISACKADDDGKTTKANLAKHDECDQLDSQVKMAVAATGLDLTGVLNQAASCDSQLGNNANANYTPPPLPSSTITSGSGSPDLGAGGYTGSGDDSDNGPLFEGYNSNKQASKAEATENAGGGGGPQGQAYPGGAPNNQAAGGGSGSGPYKDPDRGFTSGGGGFSVSGVPTSGGGSNYGRGGGGSADKDGIDWSKFLPGGEMDPSKRGIASLEGQLASKGITGANDLSNFEKVTRMMNKKRALLKP